MANSVETDWDETSPALNQARRAGAAEILALRTGVRLRTAKEHVEFDAAGVGGEHLSGSAKAYRQATAPTVRPDGTALSADDAGRLWIDSDDSRLYQWSGSAWVEVAFASLTSFHKETTLPNVVGNPSTFPFTQAGLAAGTWLVWIYGTTDDAETGANYDITATINGVTRHLFIDNHPDGTAPFNIPFIVTVTGAGTVSMTAETNIWRVQGMTGLRIA